MMSKEMIIAIETSGRTGSAAIGKNGKMLSETRFSGVMRHSAELFSTLERLLDHTGTSPDTIGKVYITAGPGSFTGLRIAVTAAKMFYFAQKAQIVAADSMDVIAENACQYRNETGEKINCIATILDAKKNFFYTAVFDRNGDRWEKCLDTQMLTAEQLLDWLAANGKENVGLLGEGLVYYADQFNAPFTRLLEKPYWSATAAGLFNVARRMAEKGLFTDAFALTPRYIREPDAIVKKKV